MRLALIAIALSSSTIAAAHPDRTCCCDGIVGRAGCHRFGDRWAAWLPPMITELGFVTRRTVFPPLPSTGDAIARTLDGSGDRRLVTYGTEMRFGVDLSGVSILGHLDVGFASTDAVLSTGVALGWRTTRGRLVFGAELLGGARWFLIGASHDAASDTTEYEDVQAAPLLDARVRADVWIAPWVSANVWLGRSLVEREDVSGGVSFAITTRSFRGR